MKNIHLLPTDKPSRLHDTFNILRLEKGYEFSPCNLNLYVTSDEEIKEGDWYLSYGKTPTLCSKKNFENPKTLKVENEIHQSGHKKIILTTDPDLIADGVQAIDDEFLEWFVKNPSCEEVLTSLEENENGLVEYVIWKRYYTETKPQEESKQSVQEYEQQGLEKYTHELKQETLKEYAERFCGIPKHWSGQKHKWSAQDRLLYNTIIESAKWQAERMYSEEDFKLFARQYYREIRLNKSNLLWDDLADKCLEEFKKK